MPIFVGNGSIEGGKSAFRIKNSSNQSVLEQSVGTSGSSFAYIMQRGTPGFVAAPLTDPGYWQGYSGWTKLSTFFNNTAYNNGNYYDTVYTRFNVPVTGPYLFIYTVYVSSTQYSHVCFAVNGDTGLRRNGNTFYRIRGYGMLSNDQMDLQIEEVINCVAGDYVEPYGYGSVSSHYPWYGSFMGVYVG